MQTMPELSREDSQFRLLFILYLVFLSAGKYKFSQLYHLTPLTEKLDACTNLLRKLKLSGDTWNLEYSTQVHLQYIRRITQVVFLLLTLKYLLLEINTLIFRSVFYYTDLTMLSFFQNIRSPVSCRQRCEPNHVQVQ